MRSSVTMRSSVALEQPHTHWLRFEHHDMVNENDVEVMPAQNLSAVKDRVAFMGYSGFCVCNDMAHMKKVTKQLQISDLNKVDPSRNVVFYIYCIDVSHMMGLSSFQASSQDFRLTEPEGLRERLAFTRQLSSRQKTDCLEHLDSLVEHMPNSSSSMLGCDDDSSFGEDFTGYGDAAAEELMFLQQVGRADRRDSTESHRETRILAQNFKKDFLAEVAGSESGGSASDHSQGVGQGEDDHAPRRRRRSFHLDLFGPPTTYKGKQETVSPPMALQRDIFLSPQDVTRAVVSAREILKDELDKGGMSASPGMRVIDVQPVSEQPQPPVRGLDSLLRTSLRCAMKDRVRQKFSVWAET